MRVNALERRSRGAQLSILYGIWHCYLGMTQRLCDTVGLLNGRETPRANRFEQARQPDAGRRAPTAWQRQ
ncbi:hypothetical protein METHPM2_350023 [Pseudomonas sp. PM2]